MKYRINETRQFIPIKFAILTVSDTRSKKDDKSGDTLEKLMQNDELLFGTIDTYLVWKLTNSKVHATDATNASRTMLYNIVTNKWDEGILKLLKIKKTIL